MYWVYLWKYSRIIYMNKGISISLPFTEIHKNNEIALDVCKMFYCEDVPILLMLEIQFIIWLAKR